MATDSDRTGTAASNRERALALLGECGPQADRLLLALTHAVLALSDPPPSPQCTRKRSRQVVSRVADYTRTPQ